MLSELHNETNLSASTLELSQARNFQEMLNFINISNSSMQKPYYELYLASLCALKGQEYWQCGIHYLDEALRIEPNLAQHSLYKALYWEFATYRGKAPKGVVGLVLNLLKGADSLSCYHLARTLYAVGSLEAALDILQNNPPQNLPSYLQSPYYELLGCAYKDLRQWIKAAKAFEKSTLLNSNPNPQLKLAECWLKAKQPLRALTVLTSLDEKKLSQSELGVAQLLKGKLQLSLGHHQKALAALSEAYHNFNHELANSEHIFELELALGQVLSLVGYHDKVSLHYEQAILYARPNQLSFARHEYAFALMHQELWWEAKSLLGVVINDQNYQMQGQAYADLAEVSYQLGEMREAESLALASLKYGHFSSACFVLGRVARDRFSLNEAISWFEKTLKNADKPVKQQAHLMIADCLAQQDYKDPERLAQHAKAALQNLPPNDPWKLVLDNHLAAVDSLANNNGQLLN